jgi:hypothetical protein
MMFPWEWGYLVGAVLLGGGLAWAIWRNAHRNKANDAITEEATRELYQEPERYEHGGREALQDKIKPS